MPTVNTEHPVTSHSNVHLESPLPAGSIFKQHEYQNGTCCHCHRDESYSHLPCEQPSAAAPDYEHVYDIDLGEVDGDLTRT